MCQQCLGEKAVNDQCVDKAAAVLRLQRLAIFLLPSLHPRGWEHYESALRRWLWSDRKSLSGGFHLYR